MRLKIRRLGGFAGVTLQAQLDTAALPADQAAQLEAAIRGLAGKPPPGAPHPDGFRYEITPLDGPDQASILIDDRDVPAALKVLVDAIAKSGQIEPR